MTLEIESSDRDGDSLTTKFWIYKEVGTYPNEVQLTPHGNKVQITLEASSTGQFHVIAEVKDDAVHPMTRYVIFVVEVEN